jgi:FSR family fosmidomycin resistance protein-like MFS transporter
LDAPRAHYPQGEDLIATVADRRDTSEEPQAPAVSETKLSDVATITLGHAANDLYGSFIAPLLPVFISSMGLSKTEAGFLSMVKQLPSLAQPVMGHLADRLGLRGVLIFTPALTAATISLAGIAPSYSAVALLLLVGGASSAAFHAVAPAIAGELAGSQNIGRGMGLWILGGELGFTIGPLLIASVVERFGVKATPWLMLIGVLASVLLFFRVRQLPQSSARQREGLPWRDALTQLRPVMVPLIGMSITRALALSAISGYLPTLLTESGATLLLAGASLTVFQGAASVGVVIGGSLSDRLDRRPVMVASNALTPLLLAAFLVAGGTGQLLALVLMGFISVMYNPAALAVIQETATQNRALATSVYLALMFLIRSIATVAVGALADHAGMRTAFALSAGVFFLGVPLALLLPRTEGPTPRLPSDVQRPSDQSAKRS